MRFRRMTIGRWMITVAALAVIITGGQIGWRSKRFHELATWHDNQASKFANVALTVLSPISLSVSADASDMSSRPNVSDAHLRTLYIGRPGFVYNYKTTSLVTAEDVERAEAELKQAQAELEAMDRLQRLVNYHNEMSRKYRQAAARPWNLVTPNPPPPNL